MQPHFPPTRATQTVRRLCRFSLTTQLAICFLAAFVVPEIAWASDEAVAVGPAEDCAIHVQRIEPAPETAPGDPTLAPLVPFGLSLSFLTGSSDAAKLGLSEDTGDLLSYLLHHLDSGSDQISLSEAVDLALRQNHALNQKRLESMAACQGRKVIWADLQPQLALSAKAYSQSGNGGGQIVIPGGPTLDFGTGGDLVRSLALSLTERIYDFGLTKGLLDASAAQHGILHYATRTSEQQLVAAVADSYLTYSLAVGQLRLRQDELGLAMEFSRQAQIQYDVGTVPHLDVLRASARVEQAKEALIVAQAQLGDAAALFFSLLGAEDKRYVPSVVSVDFLQDVSTELTLDEVTKTAIDNRPEIELQYNVLFAGEAKVDLSRSRPILQGYASALWQEPASSALAGTDNYEYGVELMWKLYNGGKDRAERERSQTELRAISEGILDLESKVELDATTAYNRFRRAGASVDSAGRGLELSSEALRAAAVGYSAGVTPYIEFQSALDANVASALNYLNALVEVKRAQVNLDRAQGFPGGYAAWIDLAQQDRLESTTMGDGPVPTEGAS